MRLVPGVCIFWSAGAWRIEVFLGKRLEGDKVRLALQVELQVMAKRLESAEVEAEALREQSVRDAGAASRAEAALKDCELT